MVDTAQVMLRENVPLKDVPLGIAVYVPIYTQDASGWRPGLDCTSKRMQLNLRFCDGAPFA